MAKMKDGSPGFMLRLLKAMGANVMVKALSGAAVLWKFLPEGESYSATIHRTFCNECWLEGGVEGSLVLALGFVFFAPMALGTVIYNSFRCGPRVRRQNGKAVLRQVREQLGLAFRYAVPSHWYYIFELYDDSHRSRALEYIYRFETKTGLYHMFRDHLSSPETTMALSDKAAFALRCEQHGVPAVSALAKAVAGEIVQMDGTPGPLPKQSFFLKANRGAGGRSASRWRYEPGSGKYYDSEGNAFSEAELTAHVKALSLSEDYVIRMLAINNAELADLNLGALNTVRVLTIMNENGHAEVTHAVLRMASSPDVVVDNFHAGGIAAKIDLESGKLGQASNMGLTADSQWWDVHPVTGGRIAGRVLPYWNEVKELACKAHGAFADQVAIGWDIAVLDDGPRLVEGNKGPDLDIIQRIYREPVGNTRFGELMVYHIGRVLQKKRAALVTADRIGSIAEPESLEGIAMNENATSATAQLLEIDLAADLTSPALRDTILETLENGGVIYLPKSGFELSEREREMILDSSITLPTRRERESRNGRPTVVFDPESGKILSKRMRQPERAEFEALMARYSDWAGTLLAKLLPSYAPALVRDRLTFRPCEREKPQGLHVDASYGRPTEGRGMLRVFCNINPTGRPRVWRVGEQFEPFARRYLASAKVRKTNPVEKLMAGLNIVKGKRTAYDHLVADIRGQAKRDAAFQADSPQRVVEFPEGSAWIAITDLVLHGALSGQHSLDQTFFVPPGCMAHPEKSSLRILERLSGASLL